MTNTGILREGDTIYAAFGDSSGMVVSLIQSNYRGMGTALAVPGLGFAFQQRAELMSLNPEHPNVYAPGKRPFHTIIPAFALHYKEGSAPRDDGVIVEEDLDWMMAFGVMGGDMQPQGHVQIVVNMVDFGWGVQEAGDLARWRHAGSSEVCI